MPLDKKLLPGLILVVSAALVAGAAEHRPHGNLKTRWAEKVDSDAPLPEHPRPALQRENWTNLNGRWDYAIIGKDAAGPEKWEGKIVVPFCAESQLSGVQRFVGAENRLWYRRCFATPEFQPGEHVMLRFGAVDWDATVWLNGKELGNHKGGYDPFSFDVTDALKKGENELVVSVWDPTDSGPQPRGKQVRNPRGIFYTAVTGIWQTVWLEVVPEVHLACLNAEGDPQSGKLTVSLVAHGDKVPVGTRAKVSVLDEGTVVATAQTEAPLGPLNLQVNNPKPWSPDSPHLYQLQITFGKDSVESYCAFRTVSWRADEEGFNRLSLNGKLLFHFGLLDQGWWPDGLYTAPTDEALRYDIEVTKAMGFNMARKHVKVEPQRWYYWADKLGLLVWQDMPSGFIHVKQPEGRSRVDHENFKRELAAVVKSFRHHPCIVAWIPYNEGWGQPGKEETNTVLQWVHQEDPSRYVGGPSGWTDHGWGDWKDVHKYPGPTMAPPMQDRVSVLGEFGGLGLAIPGHLWRDDHHWGHQKAKTLDEFTSKYEALIRHLERLVPNGLAAAVYTQTTDCESEVNGLMTYDRIPKIEPARLSKLHARLRQSDANPSSP